MSLFIFSVWLGLRSFYGMIDQFSGTISSKIWVLKVPGNLVR